MVKEEAPPVEEKPPEGESPQETPAPEGVDAVRAKLAEAEKALTEAQKEAKAHQANVTKKDAELKKQKGIDSTVSSLTDRVETLTTMVADLVDRGEDTDEKPTRKRSEEYLGQSRLREAETYNRRADTIFADAKEVLKDNPKELRYVEMLLQTRKPDEAESILSEARTPKEQPKDESKAEPKENEDEKVDKIVEERLRKRMEEKGMLESDAGGAAGGSGKVYSMGEIKTMDATEYRKAFPTMDDFYKAANEGRIKE